MACREQVKRGLLARTKSPLGLGGQVPQKLVLRETKEGSDSGSNSDLELRCLQVTLKWCSKLCTLERELESKCEGMLNGAFR